MSILKWLFSLFYVYWKHICILTSFNVTFLWLISCSVVAHTRKSSKSIYGPNMELGRFSGVNDEFSIEPTIRVGIFFKWNVGTLLLGRVEVYKEITTRLLFGLFYLVTLLIWSVRPNYDAINLANFKHLVYTHLLGGAELDMSSPQAKKKKLYALLIFVEIAFWEEWCPRQVKNFILLFLKYLLCPLLRGWGGSPPKANIFFIKIWCHFFCNHALLGRASFCALAGINVQ